MEDDQSPAGFGAPFPAFESPAKEPWPSNNAAVGNPTAGDAPYQPLWPQAEAWAPQASIRDEPSWGVRRDDYVNDATGVYRHGFDPNDFLVPPPPYEPPEQK